MRIRLSIPPTPEQIEAVQQTIVRLSPPDKAAYAEDLLDFAKDLPRRYDREASALLQIVSLVSPNF